MALLNGVSLNANTNLIVPEHGLSGTAGSFRINSTTKALEIFSGGNWIPIKYLTSSVSGGSLTTNGQYSIRTFTSSGSLVVSTAPIYADILVVGGGGGGGGFAYDAGQVAGGGGAGAFICVSNVLLSVGTYTVTIGAGGNGTNASGNVGSYSSFHLTNVCSIFAPGGHGGIQYSQTDRVAFFIGGSGSGGGGAQPTAEFNNNIVPGAGNNGANAQTYAGGGGGGAGGAGTTGAGQSDGGNGGAGRLFNGTYYAGGGAGGRNTFYSGTDGVGGSGGGGATITNGTANTGGGGGGKTFTNGGNGGSGVVIIKYLT